MHQPTNHYDATVTMQWRNKAIVERAKQTSSRDGEDPKTYVSVTQPFTNMQ